MMKVRVRRTLTPALVALVATGCAGASGNGGAETTKNSDVFIAYGNDFKDFRTWMSFDVTKGALPGTVHPDALLIEYLNKPPPSGSTEFPVGTIIVKEGTDGPVDKRKYNAMVKRGGGENPNGAVGWEWFELQNTANGTPGIVWRGVGPPNGVEYGGDPTGGCNTCHVECGNDAVCAKAVQLVDF